MPRIYWWDNLRTFDAIDFSKPRSDTRRRLANRRAKFEQLEDRLVLTFALHPGPVADEVIVSPAAMAGEFDVMLGPAIVNDAIGGNSGPPIVDLSTNAIADRRYAVPASSNELLFRVDTSERYRLTAAGHPQVGELQQGLFGYQSFDVDQLLIEPIHVEKFAFATDTTLVAALNPGNMSFLIADASGWSNGPTESAETRSLAWFGYTDSTGYTYPDYSYTRNVASNLDEGLWASGGIWYDASVGAYRVPLNAPWTGPAIAAGTAVRNATSGPQLSEPFPESLVNSPVRWPQLVATIDGEWENGQRDEFAFRPGTAFIQPFSSVNGTIWNEIAFGLERDFPGPTSSITAPTSTGQIVLDLDVLAKQVRSFTGDFNRDGKIDAADYTVWRNGLGTTRLVPFSGADGNGNGEVDALDYQLWRANFGAAVSMQIDSATATHGTATIVAGPNGDQIHYESDPWFIGSDVVNYMLRDAGTGATYSSHIVIDSQGSNFEQDAATIALLEAQGQIITGNQAPLAQYDPSYIVGVGETLSPGNLLEPFSDPGQQLVVRLLTGTTHGALRLNCDGSFEYTPVDGFIGIDTFRYEAFDGLNATTATAMIEVLSLPDLVERRLREIGLGMLNYENSRKQFPVSDNSAYFDENGLPYLSWRVHMLPYVGFNSLYSQFHLDEPWDSPNNLPLLSQMPDIFRSPGDLGDSTMTRMQTFTGPDAPFGNHAAGVDQVGPRIADFRDGDSHTILVAQSAADAAVPWTKPADMDFDVDNPLAALGTIGSEDIQALMADGSTIKLLSSIDAATFKALVTIDGNEIVDAATLMREYREAKGVVDLPAGVRENNYLKQLALAAHTYADARKVFPIASGASNFDDDGNPFVSWRVHLLPYLGYVNLYERFHLNEPWDSPNNLPLLAEMPDIFRSAGDTSNSTTTRVQNFTGPDAPFGYLLPGLPQVGPSFAQISDGTSHTILYVEAAAEQAVPWTKPDDLEFDKNDPLVGIDVSDGIRVVFFDGHVSILRPDISEEDFSALVTRRGREPIDSSDFSVNDSAPFKNISQRKNELRQIMNAMHDYENSIKRFPANRVDAAGTPLLSWRVMILPYIEQRNLFDQFHLNEPWDSPHNLSLLKFMPDIFRSGGDPLDSTTTSVMHFTGPGAPFPSPTDANQLGPRNQDISDGLSNTIAVIEAGPEVAAPWTKPVDLPLYMNNPFSAFGELGEEFLAAYFDGHIESLSSLLSPGALKARLTHNGGEVLSEPNEIVTDPGFYVIHSGGDTTTNEFGVDSFYVVLDRAPVGQVVIDLSTSNNMVAVLDQPRLTFTAANWHVPQRVAFRGVDNHVVNADQTVDVTLSIVDALSDVDYQPVPTQMFAATVVDDEPQPPTLAGDYNRDGNVGAADYTVWRNNLGSNHQFPYSGADGNGDGQVDPVDFQNWRGNFGATTPSSIILASELATPPSASSGTAAMADASIDTSRSSPATKDAGLSAIGFDLGTSTIDTTLNPKRILRAASVAATNNSELLLLAVDVVANRTAPITDYEAIDAALADNVGENRCDTEFVVTFGRLP